jgi:two-component system, LytTR family, sensor histidine kinase AlgZ
MHPILNDPRRLLFYFLGGSPFTAAIVYWLMHTGGLSLGAAALVGIPISVLGGFMCLMAWYPCRAMPFGKFNFHRILLTHFGTALLDSGLWVLAIKFVAYQLSVSTRIYGGLDGRISKDLPAVFGAGVLSYLLAVASAYIALAIQASQEAQAREAKAHLLARDAELKALKAQVNPHFLFNSLNSISALTSSDAAKAREMCILLGDFLRRTLGLGEKSVIPLDEEMSLIRAFLAVEKIRFGPRINMEESIAKEALDVQVPPLLLQPLVENAVAHGIANLVEGGRVRLDARCNDGKVVILIENTFDPEAPPRRKGGVGLANVRQRLTARYGNAATFQVTKEGDNFRVALAFPAEQEARTA